MTSETILIAGFSARALAQSARRAGFEPLVVDCFGDTDTREAAHEVVCLPARVSTGFTYRPLAVALAELTRRAPRPPVGLVLGAGFECSPKLIAHLAEDYRLLGSSADVIRHAKDPGQFFSMLQRLGIRHPETRLDPPDRPDGWLMKRIGGSGGLHVHDCPAAPRSDPRRYFQRKIDGQSISLLGVLSDRSSAFAVSRQWTSPRPKRPYRYGGSAGSLFLDEDLEARLISISLDVAGELGLIGLVSFDFIVQDDDAFLIEVNPRPGASIDVFDDTNGTLFRVHLEAALGGDPAGLLAELWHPPVAASAAYLYADRGGFTVPDIEWPDWVRDRPRPGTVIRKSEPIATACATGLNLDEVQRTCIERVSALEILFYGEDQQI